MPHSHTFRYRLNHEEKQLEGRLTVFNWVTDGFDHLVLKLLSYFMFYDPEIKIDVDIDYHYRPDLVIEGPNHQPRLWAECGKADLKKPDKVATKCHHCDLYVVQKDKTSMERLYRHAKRKVKHIERVKFIGFEPGYVDSLVYMILNTSKRTVELDCRVSGSCIEINDIASEIYKMP
jgi:uncharacterized protein YaeQ